MNVDSFVARRWPTENCWHLVRAAWLELTGVDLGDRTPARMAKAALIGRFADDVPAFERLAGPADPSIVLMQSPGRVPHVGVHLRGRVLQLVDRQATFLPVDRATAGWADVGFYR